MNLRLQLLRWCGCAGILVSLAAGEGRDEGKRGGPAQPQQDSSRLEVPAHSLDVIVCRPTRDTVTLSILSYADSEGQVSYGTTRSATEAKTPSCLFKKGDPVELLLEHLQPDTYYFYQVRLAGTHVAEGGFRTARLPGTSFVFTVTADSHLDANTEPEIYRRTLDNALADGPDFHVDLGDTFMTEKHRSRVDATRQYLAQRYYFGLLCHSTPLFLVLGNHDGEGMSGRGADREDLASWSAGMRKRFFPNPVPNSFYEGNARPHPTAGLLENYYAWTWGDALFVVLDPFWSSPSQRGRGADPWERTLGDDQYRWLTHILQSSRATWKFVFIHHLVGGLDSQNRGGAEAARLFEWGGQDLTGTDEFRKRRPNWPAPIHQLLVQHGVQMVFHGHDHFYACQQKDGLTYLLVPQPGHPGGDRAPRSAAEYGYREGVLLGGAGHVRVTVRPDRIAVAYRSAAKSTLQAFELPSTSRP